MSGATRFGRILVANRGEIAVRVIRACRTAGLATVAVYSEADRRRAPRRPRGRGRVSSAPRPRGVVPFDSRRLLAAARATGPGAVHPGFGFLSENAEFARAVVDAGLVWIGPPPDGDGGDGIEGRVRGANEGGGVPVVPGSHDLSPEHLFTLGLPVVVKASAGGGGKGMRVVRSEGELAAAIASCRREAEAAFGDPTVYVERYLEHPRHIEVQVFGDVHGHVVALGERECSLQRRHQKVVEESPSPVVTPELRARIERGGRGGGESRRLRQRRDGRVPPRRRRSVLLPRDEHAAPGRAPGHGGGVRRRPRHAPARRRRGRAASRRPPAAPVAHAIEARVYAGGSRRRLPAAGRARSSS